MTKNILRLTLAASIVFLIAGCGKKHSAESPQQSKIFDSADPALKANWQTVVTANGTNGFVTAIFTCRKIQERTDLTAEQRQTVNALLNAIMERMSMAASKGDPNAIKAVEEVRRRGRSG